METETHEFQVVAGKQETPKKNFQPIRVDNWGIFLLSRLQNYFTKKELCDLTLRFPAQNAQIKVQSPKNIFSYIYSINDRCTS